MRKEITSATLEVEEVAVLGIIAKKEYAGNRSAALRAIVHESTEARAVADTSTCDGKRGANGGATCLTIQMPVRLLAGRGTGKAGDNRRRGTARLVTFRIPARRNRQDFRANNGRVVATIEGDCLKKQVDGSRHFMQKPAGIAFDASILESAERAAAGRLGPRQRDG